MGNAKNIFKKGQLKTTNQAQLLCEGNLNWEIINTLESLRMNQ